MVKYQYFELYFIANILILIVLIDSKNRILGYRLSLGVTFENFEILRFLQGPNMVVPLKFKKKSFETGLPRYNKSPIIKKIPA